MTLCSRDRGDRGGGRKGEASLPARAAKGIRPRRCHKKNHRVQKSASVLTQGDRPFTPARPSFPNLALDKPSIMTLLGHPAHNTPLLLHGAPAAPQPTATPPCIQQNHQDGQVGQRTHGWMMTTPPSLPAERNLLCSSEEYQSLICTSISTTSHLTSS